MPGRAIAPSGDDSGSESRSVADPQSSTGLATTTYSSAHAGGIKSAPSFSSKCHISRDDDGLQPVDVYFNDGLHPDSPEKVPAPRDGDGLITRDSERGNKVFDMMWVPFASNRRRRLIWTGVAVAAIVVILAAVLGGVLGTRSNRMSDAVVTPSQPSSRPPVPTSSNVVRGRSMSGTWNGTGLAPFLLIGGQGLLVFQDHAGNLVQIFWNISAETGAVSVNGPSSVIAIPANRVANGTGISGLAISNGDGSHGIQIFFVNQDGFLDEFAAADKPFVGTWRPGQTNLSSYRIKVPTDNRPALYADSASGQGTKPNSRGTRIFAGGEDMHLHQYSLDENSLTYYNGSAYEFPDSWAYGSAAAFVTSNGNASTRTLLTSDRDGRLQSFVQSYDHSANDTNWPKGGDWSTAVLSAILAAPNASVDAAIAYTDGPTEGKLISVFAASDGTLVSQDIKGFPDKGFQVWSNPVNRLTSGNVLQGSAIIDVYGGPNIATVFFQDEGTTLAWKSFNTASRTSLASGHIIERNGTWSAISDSNDSKKRDEHLAANYEMGT